MTASSHIVGTAAPRDRSQALAWLALATAVTWATFLLFEAPAPWQAATLLFVAPLAEESLMRAGLQEWMLQRGSVRWHANLAAACCFALLHGLVRGDAVLAVAVLAPALLIGVIYDRSRSLRLCIAAHMCMNSFWLSFGSALPIAVSIR